MDTSREDAVLQPRVIPLLLLGLLLGPRLALGEEPRPGDAPTQARQLAREHLRRAKRHLALRQWPEAIAELRTALRHHPHRIIHYNLALVHAHQGDRLTAHRHLAEYLRQARPTDPPLDPVLEQVRRTVGVLVVVAADPALGIYVDGRLAGTGRIAQPCEAGSRAVDLRRGDRVVARRLLEVKGGQETRWDVTGPDAPEALRDLRSGPRPRRRLHVAWAATVAGVAVATLVTAAVLSARTRSLHEEFLGDRGNRALALEGERTQRATNALWGVGGGAALVAVVLATVTLRRARREQSGLTVAPLGTPGGMGLSLTWRQ